MTPEYIFDVTTTFNRSDLAPAVANTAAYNPNANSSDGKN